MNSFKYNDLVLKIKKLELKRNRLELYYEYLKTKKPFFLCQREITVWKEKLVEIEKEAMDNMELLFDAYAEYENLLDSATKNN